MKNASPEQFGITAEVAGTPLNIQKKGRSLNVFPGNTLRNTLYFKTEKLFDNKIKHID